jgi:plasmid maintenance system antidote protein VapI
MRYDTLFHVGEYLEDELNARGWTTRDCAERMGGNVEIDTLTLDLTIAASYAPHGHVANKCFLGPDTAAGLAKAFGSSAETWLNLDAEYHRRLAQVPVPEAQTVRAEVTAEPKE